MSICLFLLRIAVSKAQRVILYIVMAISAIMGSYFFFLFVFQCWPVAYFWEQYTGAQGKCINPEDYHSLYLRVLRCHMLVGLDLLHSTSIHGLAPSNESKNEDLRLCYSCSFSYVSIFQLNPLLLSHLRFARRYLLMIHSASAATHYTLPIHSRSLQRR